MASTGTFLFHPELAELVDDAFEQAGIDPAKLDPRHLKSAARSAELMMGTWFTKGWTQWRIESATQALAAGVNTFSLPIGGWDIFHAMIAVDGEDAATPLRAISRTDYSALNDKTLTGRPDRFFVDRSGYLGADPRSAVTVYLVPDRAYNVQYWYIRRSEDIGNPSNTLDLPWHWGETFTVNLAARLAKKFAPDRFSGLRQEGEIMLREAMTAERELADLTFKVSAGGSRGY
jgi:hypothetical protein